MMPVAAGTPVVIWGAAGHARVVAEILRLQDCSVVGFIDDVDLHRAGESFGGAHVLGGLPALDRLSSQGVRHGVVAVGSNSDRLRLAAIFSQYAIELITVVHPFSSIAADAVVGNGGVIAAGAVVGVSVRLGRCVIINTGASVDHDCVLGDGVHLSPGSHVCGRVKIGNLAWIGAGATVIDGLTIGSATLVGAGSVVTRSLPDGVTAVGVPARIAQRAGAHARRVDGSVGER